PPVLGLPGSPGATDTARPQRTRLPLGYWYAPVPELAEAPHEFSQAPDLDSQSATGLRPPRADKTPLGLGRTEKCESCVAGDHRARCLAPSKCALRLPLPERRRLSQPQSKPPPGARGPGRAGRG